jgi:hypothetical protein
MLHLPIPLALVLVYFTLSILKYTNRITLLLYFLKYASLFALFCYVLTPVSFRGDSLHV